MGNLNDVFLEEFKRLDKMCRERYQSEKGVTSYISDMKRTATDKSRSIPNWDADLKALVRLRHLRNQLSHEVGTFHRSMCTQRDIAWLRAFNHRIFKHSDPLALLRRKGKNPNQRKKPDPHKTPAASKLPKRISGCLTAFVVLLCLALTAALIVIILQLLSI